MKTASPTYLWWNELAAQMIEGAADGFLIVMGGSAATQLGNGVAISPVTLKQLVVSIAVGAGLYAASFLKTRPLPTVAYQEQKKTVSDPVSNNVLPTPALSDVGDAVHRDTK